MRGALPVAVVALLAFAGLGALPSAADHVQNLPNGQTIVFDHRGGNEWWVQVRLGGSGGASSARVDATDGDGVWHALKERTWEGCSCWFAGSFHIEPGHLVKFRASAGDAVTRLTESCWFTHPQGVEQCGEAPANKTWRVTEVGTIGPAALDASVGDGDRDGRREVYVPMENGLAEFSWTGSAWQRVFLNSVHGWRGVAAVDGDRDGKSEVYATLPGELWRFVWDGSAWRRNLVALLPDPVGIGGLVTLGDVEDDGLRELYVALVGDDAPVYKVWFKDGRWHKTVIATTPSGTFSLWVGDGNRDGDVELYLGGGRGEVFQVDRTGGAWVRELIGVGDPIWSIQGVVVGDPDRSGGREVVAADSNGTLYRFTFTGSAWQRSVLTQVPNQATDLFLGDGDDDGREELYVPSDGNLYQVRWDGAWLVEGLGEVPALLTAVVVGDGDHDGLREVYAPGAAFLGEGEDKLWQYAFRANGTAPPPPPPPPPSNFTAEFFNVRGNEWWVETEVRVSGGTLAGVEAREDRGDWIPLRTTSWGSWAKSIHVEPGHQVQFRAVATDGREALSGSYAWPP